MATNGNRRGAIAVAAIAMTLAACGGSDDGGGDTEAFCEQLRALDAADDEAGEDLTAAVDQFDALLADAPDEVADDLRIVIDVFTEFDSIDDDDPDAFEQFVELFERPEFVEATERLERFGVDECGLDPADDAGGDVDPADDAGGDVDPADDAGGDVDPAEAASEGDDTGPGDLERDETATGDVESGGGDTADGEVKTTTVPGDPYDEAFWGPIDPAELSIPGLEQHLDVNYPDSGWFGDKMSGSSIAGDQLIVYADVEADEALRLCDAVLEYASGIVAEAQIEVEVEQGTSGVTLAVGEGSDGCTAA